LISGTYTDCTGVAYALLRPPPPLYNFLMNMPEEMGRGCSGVERY